MKRNEDIPYGHYSHGDSSEVIMYFEQYDFLVMTLSSIHEFILENSKNLPFTNKSMVDKEEMLEKRSDEFTKETGINNGTIIIPIVASIVFLFESIPINKKYL